MLKIFIVIFLLGCWLFLRCISSGQEVAANEPFETDKIHLEDYPDFHS
jgi:hypothetical protein